MSKNVTTLYKHLREDIDLTLTLENCLANCYKNATGRLHLLATVIYKSLIVPVLPHCSILSVVMPKTQAIC